MGPRSISESVEDAATNIPFLRAGGTTLPTTRAAAITAWSQTRQAVATLIFSLWIWAIMWRSTAESTALAAHDAYPNPRRHCPRSVTTKPLMRREASFSASEPVPDDFQFTSAETPERPFSRLMAVVQPVDPSAPITSPQNRSFKALPRCRLDTRTGHERSHPVSSACLLINSDRAANGYLAAVVFTS